MDRRYIEQSPQNVIWQNLSMSAYEQNVRTVISYALSVGLILAWTFPGAFLRDGRWLIDSRLHFSAVKHIESDRRVPVAQLARLPRGRFSGYQDLAGYHQWCSASSPARASQHVAPDRPAEFVAQRCRLTSS
jgi:hypothetical protein